MTTQDESANASLYAGYAQHLGIPYFLEHQVEALDRWDVQRSNKACLYFKTGAGKTATSLAMLRMASRRDALVVAPPSTHKSWAAQAEKLGIRITTISHAKFRQDGYKLSRNLSMIVDEFHLLGGHTGKGWKKLDRFAQGAVAELIICSATPNYNDAERAYCIQHVLDADSCRGGYLAWLYENCNTKQNPFSQTPLVDDKVPFRNFDGAADFISKLPNVYYLEDDAVYDIEDINVDTPLPLALEMYGYEGRKHRMIASRIEEKHTRTYLGLVGNDGHIHPHVLDIVELLIRNATTPVLIFAAHSKIAMRLRDTLLEHKQFPAVITGDTTKKDKENILALFLRGTIPVLIGTASLATGTDGMDKMCDTLIILDDTDDASLRRQLVGRILPRGASVDPTSHSKRIYRINLSTFSE